jgi:hypothetical protein
MKVNIGPYKSWIGPYQVADKIFFWQNERIITGDEPFLERWDYKLKDKLGDFLGRFMPFFNWLHDRKERTVDVRIDYYDTWSMDHTLAHIIHPMLVQLKNTHYGSAHVDPEDTPHIEPDPDATEYEDKKVHERWDWVLDEMIWTFAAIIEDKTFIVDGLYDTEAHDEHDERIKNGLRLFGKYYRNLWD